MARPVLAALLAVAAAAGCTDAEIGTSPFAHESPPLPDAPTVRLDTTRFLGGSGLDRIDDVLVMDERIYVVGGTSSPDFPTTDGSTLDPTAPAGCTACPFAGFVAALTFDGTIVWSKLIDSPGFDRLSSLTFGNAGGNGLLYVAGTSGERPGLAGWHGGASPERGEQDGLVCQLQRLDGALVACRYLGGNGPGGVSAIAQDVSGSGVLVALTTEATEDLHLDAAYAPAFVGRHRATSAGADGVVLKLSAELTAADNLVWATYAGGSGTEDGMPSVYADGTSVFYLGNTTSTDVPTPGGWLTAAPAGGNVFLARFDNDGTSLTYGTYVGGDGQDETTNQGLVAIDGVVHVGITTTSAGLPARAGSAQPLYGGGGGPGCGSGDVWMARIFSSTTGAQSLSATTYLGGAAGERFASLDWLWTPTGGVIVVTGQTLSSNFPVERGVQSALAGSPCTVTPGNADAFATAVDLGRSWLGSTYLGGTTFDRGTAIAPLHDRTGLVVVGDTTSSSFPLVEPIDGTLSGGDDGFVAVFGPDVGPPPPNDGGFFEDGGFGGLDAIRGDYFISEDYDESSGCCGTSRAPSPGMLGLAGLVLMMLVRRRRGR